MVGFRGNKLIVISPMDGSPAARSGILPLDRIIRVDGEVKGELRGTEQIIISPTGQVSGDIRAPRVVLEDGCQFKGSIDMEHDKQAQAAERGTRSGRLRPGINRPVRPGSDNGPGGAAALS